ncbi:hypothetical protein BESB_025740 [Besnoitia besnoiti]|uniref:Uncharacterized protein n=1 Tax=Besnoitia besnoiti TaxID=94643 RepID=A0A2A9M892_BESBE|nr:uncharacterized protein BESB_025740 [Besnoitia besnoiti]PFH31600.1 hypothetical protein BESB_025740 [Besnoitia besnoiti]
MDLGTFLSPSPSRQRTPTEVYLPHRKIRALRLVYVVAIWCIGTSVESRNRVLCALSSEAPEASSASAADALVRTSSQPPATQHEKETEERSQSEKHRGEEDAITLDGTPLLRSEQFPPRRRLQDTLRAQVDGESGGTEGFGREGDDAYFTNEDDGADDAVDYYSGDYGDVEEDPFYQQDWDEDSDAAVAMSGMLEELGSTEGEPSEWESPYATDAQQDMNPHAHGGILAGAKTQASITAQRHPFRHYTIPSENSTITSLPRPRPPAQVWAPSTFTPSSIGISAENRRMLPPLPRHSLSGLRESHFDPALPSDRASSSPPAAQRQQHPSEPYFDYDRSFSRTHMGMPNEMLHSHGSPEMEPGQGLPAHSSKVPSLEDDWAETIRHQLPADEGNWTKRAKRAVELSASGCTTDLQGIEECPPPQFVPPGVTPADLREQLLMIDSYLNDQHQLESPATPTTNGRAGAQREQEEHDIESGLSHSSFVHAPTISARRKSAVRSSDVDTCLRCQKAVVCYMLYPGIHTLQSCTLLFFPSAINDPYSVFNNACNTCLFSQPRNARRMVTAAASAAAESGAAAAAGAARHVIAAAATAAANAATAAFLTAGGGNANAVEPLGATNPDAGANTEGAPRRRLLAAEHDGGQENPKQQAKRNSLQQESNTKASSHEAREAIQKVSSLQTPLLMKHVREHPWMMRAILAAALFSGVSTEQVFHLDKRSRDPLVGDNQPILEKSDANYKAPAFAKSGGKSTSREPVTDAETSQKREHLELVAARQHPGMARFWETAAGLLVGASEKDVLALRRRRQYELIQTAGRSSVSRPAFALQTEPQNRSSAVRVARNQTELQHPRMTEFWEVLGAVLTGNINAVKHLRMQRMKRAV